MENELEQVTNKQQFKTKTTQTGFSRKLHFESDVFVSERNISPNISLDFVDNEDIYLNDILLSRNQYNFHKLLKYDSSYKNKLAVSYYPDENSLEKSDNYIFNFWYKIPENNTDKKEYQIISYKRTELNEKIEKIELILQNSISIQKLEGNKEILINIDGNTVIGKYENYNRSKKILTVSINKQEITNTNLLSDEWIDIKGSFSLIELRELISSDILKIYFVNENILRIYLGDKIQDFNVKPVINKWTLVTVKFLFSLGNIINIKQFDFDDKIFKIVTDETVNVDNEIKCSYIDYMNETKEYKLHYTDIQLCNITAYNKNIPDEKLLEVAQQYIISDPQNVIFIDRMQPEKQNSYIGITR